MPIYTFSARATRPADVALVERTKAQCETTGMCFSHLIITLLREHENATREVRDSKPSIER